MGTFSAILLLGILLLFHGTNSSWQDDDTALDRGTVQDAIIEILDDTQTMGNRISDLRNSRG